MSEEFTKQPEETPVRTKPSYSRAFNDAVLNTATEFALDADEIQRAYSDKQESLSTIWDRYSGAKDERVKWVGWSVAWLVFMPPIALYTAYRAFESNQQMDDLKGQVKRTVVKNTMSDIKP